MNKKKVLICVFSILAVVAIILFVRWYNSSARADKIFERDYDEIIQVVNYLNSLEDLHDPHISVRDENGVLSHGYGDKMQIPDEDIKDTISLLFRKGYDYIGKDGNTIYFVRWTHYVFGWDKGFALSIDGSGKIGLDIQFLTVQEELSEPDWYYYVSDYNEWRSNRYG